MHIQKPSGHPFGEEDEPAPMIPHSKERNECTSPHTEAPVPMHTGPLCWGGIHPLFPRPRTEFAVFAVFAPKWPFSKGKRHFLPCGQASPRCGVCGVCSKVRRGSSLCSPAPPGPPAGSRLLQPRHGEQQGPHNHGQKADLHQKHEKKSCRDFGHRVGVKIARRAKGPHLDNHLHHGGGHPFLQWVGKRRAAVAPRGAGRPSSAQAGLVSGHHP